MREIKFRAWCKYNNLMWSVEGLSYNGPNSSLSHVLLARPHISQVFPVSDVELMQYTGLKDTRKHDIYEGDILSIEGATARVVFWERPPEFGLDFAHSGDRWCEDWNLTDDSGRMEVIGNIYEHPELLPHHLTISDQTLTEELGYNPEQDG
jgi:YopX protein